MRDVQGWEAVAKASAAFAVAGLLSIAQARAYDGAGSLSTREMLTSCQPVLDNAPPQSIRAAELAGACYGILDLLRRDINGCSCVPDKIDTVAVLRQVMPMMQRIVGLYQDASFRDLAELAIRHEYPCNAITKAVPFKRIGKAKMDKDNAPTDDRSVAASRAVN